jgi:hypothetical protein
MSVVSVNCNNLEPRIFEWNRRRKGWFRLDKGASTVCIALSRLLLRHLRSTNYSVHAQKQSKGERAPLIAISQLPQPPR